MNRLELRAKRHRHHVKRAWYLAGWLINQDLAGCLLPPKTFVVLPHAIDAKEQCEIYFPLFAQEVRRMLNESGSVAASLKRWNRQHTPDAANEHRPAVRASGLLEDGDMAYGAGDVVIENEAELLPVLGTIGESETSSAEYVVTPAPKLTRLFRRELTNPADVQCFRRVLPCGRFASSYWRRVGTRKERVQ